MSRTGYIIFYAGCPVLWSSRLQTEIALPTAEAEYIVLSTAMREVIPYTFLMEELAEMFPLYMLTPTVHFKVFKDN
eukprot:7780494-Ditylum_brightwellii.AAC.1